ncbi:T9SS type A sorting domain-containing protein [Flammeovirga sp. MY04]|uniref:T9SS type A sorting domain-containing protein n=1 Tax=Flammeovirga sp. MY04 TaxID=1191459 RepID=UPI00080608B9|nr:T9SS type A sorting domain-containing protein [Flammeovirga sp. MY04]ANQ52463.1 T9SS type A sorting domain-containing protein [Flammeovirga sp. MY04]
MKGLYYLIIFLGLSLSTALGQTNYYFSSDGDDNNQGSIDSPWKTLAKASAIAETESKGGILQPGDQMLFRKGDTFEGQLNIFASGSESKPIVIGSYGEGELPIISGSGNIPEGDFIEAVRITNVSYLIIENLWVKNDRKHKGNITWSTNNSIGIKVMANKWGNLCKGLTFRGLKITDVFGIDMIDWEGKFTLDYYTAHGIFIDSEPDQGDKQIGVDDVLIENCYFHNIGARGINVRHLTNIRNNPIDEEDRNRNYIIRNNTFEKLGGDGIVFASMYNAIVEKNDFIDLGWGDHTSSTDRYYGRGEGCWIWNARNIVVQYNRQYHSRGFGDTYGAGGHVDFFCKNSVFQYNYSEDTEGGFCEILGDNDNSIFRYNVSKNDGFRDHHGFTLWVSGFVGADEEPVRSTNNYIYNNTIILDKPEYKPNISIYAKDTYVYNNIFKTSNGATIGAKEVMIDIEEGSELVISNNLFTGDISRRFTVLDDNAIIQKDPMLQNESDDDILGYQIQENSPVIDQGKKFPEPIFPMAGQGIFKNFTLKTTHDIYGNEIDVTNLIPNIGADNNFNSKKSSDDDVTSTDDIKSSSFKIYPNPVTDKLTIQSISDAPQVLSMYSILGEEVFKTHFKNVYELPIHQYQKGTYIIKLMDNNGSVKTEKVMIQ